VHDEVQREVAMRLMSALGPDVQTEVRGAEPFWEAKEYH